MSIRPFIIQVRDILAVPTLAKQTSQIQIIPSAVKAININGHIFDVDLFVFYNPSNHMATFAQFVNSYNIQDETFTPRNISGITHWEYTYRGQGPTTYVYVSLHIVE